MKIAVVTSFPAIRDMDINARQFGFILSILMVKILFITINDSFAQEVEETIVVLQYEDRTREVFKISDQNDINERVNSLIEQLRGKGYILANIDSALILGDTASFFLYKGPKYKLKAGDDYFYPIHDSLTFFKVSKKISDAYVNEGYPFTKVMLDSMIVLDNSIKGRMTIDSGPEITFDSLVINKGLKTKNSFLQNHLRINYGKKFQQRPLDGISRRINSLSFLELRKPAEISFQNNNATLYLDLEEKKANRFDGILGFLPRENEGDKLLITGELDLRLRNLFGGGQNVDITWRGTKPRSQVLDLNYIHPYPFGIPLKAGFSYHLLKEDTNFVNLNAQISLSIPVSINGQLSLFYKNKRSNVLSAEFFSSRDNLDNRLNGYGLAFDINNQDNPFVPKNGYRVRLSAEVSGKKVIRNSLFPQEVYDSVRINSNQYAFEADIAFSIPINRYLNLYSNISGGSVINDEIFINDLYRIGGINSLRGFTENQFFASNYILGSTELRLFFEQYSYLFLFIDQSYLQFNLESSNFRDYPTGLGVGLSLFTESGSFNFVYALGRTDDQPLSINLSKIHFGYTGQF
ncbi:MAG TPA: BamA/TamA family outer membrane protein [Cyclobacteriaceae bacterium]